MTGLNALLGYPERGGSRVHADGINQKCILSPEAQQPKPAFYAYQNLCAAMDGKYKVFETNYGIQVVDQGIFYGIGEYEDAYPSVPLLASYKTAENKHLVAVWLPWNPQEYLPKLGKVNIEITNAKFSAPVLVAVGTEDVIGGSAGDLAAIIPGAKALEIPGRDHMKAVGDRTYKQGVLDFLDQRR